MGLLALGPISAWLTSILDKRLGLRVEPGLSAIILMVFVFCLWRGKKLILANQNL